MPFFLYRRCDPERNGPAWHPGAGENVVGSRQSAVGSQRSAVSSQNPELITHNSELHPLPDSLEQATFPAVEKGAGICRGGDDVLDVRIRNSISIELNGTEVVAFN